MTKEIIEFIKHELPGGESVIEPHDSFIAQRRDAAKKWSTSSSALRRSLRQSAREWNPNRPQSAKR